MCLFIGITHIKETFPLLIYPRNIFSFTWNIMVFISKIEIINFNNVFTSSLDIYALDRVGRGLLPVLGKPLADCNQSRTL